MQELVKVEGRPGCVLFVVFDDGTEGEIDLSERLNGPMLAPLKADAMFAQVELDNFGAPSRPNGVDWAPDGLYAELHESTGDSSGTDTGSR